MKKKFFEYYKPTDDDSKNLIEQSLLVFDTNVLLSMFRFSSDSAEELISLFTQRNEQIWIPHHVGYEFHNNIHRFLEKKVTKYEEKLQSLKRIQDGFTIFKDDVPKRDFNRINTIIKNLTNKYNTLKETELRDISHNPLLLKLAELFDGKVGDAFTQTELDEIYLNGEGRYERKRPPGYMDKSKGGTEQYGDLVIWKEIIKKAKNDRRSIIFITNETKEDWFVRKYGQTIGPRKELLREFYDETKQEDGGEVPSFYCYNTMNFLEKLNSFGYVSDNLITVVDKLKQEQNEQNNNLDEENTGNIGGPNNNSVDAFGSSGETGNNNSVS